MARTLRPTCDRTYANRSQGAGGMDCGSVCSVDAPGAVRPRVAGGPTTRRNNPGRYAGDYGPRHLHLGLTRSITLLLGQSATLLTVVPQP